MDPLQYLAIMVLFPPFFRRLLQHAVKAASAEPLGSLGPLGARLALSTHQVQVIQALGDMTRPGMGVLEIILTWRSYEKI